MDPLSHGLLAWAITRGECWRMTPPIIRVVALAEAVVIGDNDPDPRVREETRKLAERRAEELNGQLFFPPDEYKEVDEWILDKPTKINVLNGK